MKRDHTCSEILVITLQKQDRLCEKTPPSHSETAKSNENTQHHQLSNIERIIANIDTKISTLRVCIADIQMGLTIEQSASKHGLSTDLVKYEVDYE